MKFFNLYIIHVVYTYIFFVFFLRLYLIRKKYCPKINFCSNNQYTSFLLFFSQEYFYIYVIYMSISTNIRKCTRKYIHISPQKTQQISTYIITIFYAIIYKLYLQRWLQLIKDEVNVCSDGDCCRTFDGNCGRR